MRVAVEGSNTVGLIGWWSAADHVEVESLYVRPSHWGTPAASRLVASLAQDVHPKPLELWTLRDNARARRFYEREGFHLRDAVRSIEYLDRVVEQVRYFLEAPCT